MGSAVEGRRYPTNFGVWASVFVVLLAVRRSVSGRKTQSVKQATNLNRFRWLKFVLRVSAGRLPRSTLFPWAGKGLKIG